MPVPPEPLVPLVLSLVAGPVLLDVPTSLELSESVDVVEFEVGVVLVD